MVDKQPPDHTPASGAKKRNFYVSIACITAAIAVALAILTEPISQLESHYYRMLIAGTAVVLTSAYSYLLVVEKKYALGGYELFSVHWIFTQILAASCIFGAFNYYQNDRSYFTTLKDNSDTTYYYLNSKYFKELGYFELYPAMLLADEEKNHHLEYISVYRDLHSYKTVDKSHIHGEREQIKSKFEPERWKAFSHDVDYLISHNRPASWRYFFIDHGYNPPPTWTVVGGFLSNIISVENAKVITMIDFVLVVLMFIAVARTFGINVMLLSLLWYLCSFSGRWPVLGESLLRFDWVVALVLSVCALKFQRFRVAGMLLAYSALNRIFPAMFFFPYLALFVFDVVKERTISKQHQDFILGAGFITMLLVSVGLVQYGGQTFVTSAENLLLHQSSSYSSHRVGMADALIYGGERSGADLAKTGGLRQKEVQIGELKYVLVSFAVCGIILVCLLLYRQRKPIYEYIQYGIFPIFCLTNLQINYFNMRLLLLLWHLGDPRRARNIFGLSFLFMIEVLAQYGMVRGDVRYAITSSTSIGLLIYFSVMISSVLFDTVEVWKPGSRILRFKYLIGRWPWMFILLGHLFYILTLNIYWTQSEKSSYLSGLVQPFAGGGRSVTQAQLSAVKDSGTRWNQDGAIVIEEFLTVNLRVIYHNKEIDISFDNNDKYQLNYFLEGTLIAQAFVQRVAGDPGRGLIRKTVTVPVEARESGYDQIVVKPSGGDGKYSVGHLIPLVPGPTDVDQAD